MDLPGVSKEFTSPPEAPIIWLASGHTTLKKSRYCTRLDNGVCNVEYRVHENNVNNLLLGFCKRVWRYKGKDLIPCLRERCPKFERAMRGHPVLPWTRQQVVDAALPRRRKVMAAAAESLATHPLTRRDSYVSTFVKAEKFNYTAKPDADPRLIQPRSARFLVEHGTFIKPIEPLVYKAMGKLNSFPMIAKGFNAEESAAILRAKWDKYKDPVCVTLDAARFDMHKSVSMLKLQHRIYRRFMRSPVFEKCMAWQLKLTGFARAGGKGFKYQVDGRTASGDNDTALGNCVVMCGIIYELVEDRAEVFDNGDDCLLICERGDMPTRDELTQHYHQYGFHVVVEDVVDVFEQIEFCQTRPVWADRWVMSRSPTCIAKDLTYIGPRTALGYWLQAIGECGGALSDGVPILSAFYRCLRASGEVKGIRNSMQYSCGLTNLAKRMTCINRPITAEARVSFYRAFGVEPDAQIAIELSLAPLGEIHNITDYFKTRTQTLLDYFHGKTTQT